MELLTCSKCKQQKPATREYFSPNRATLSGLYSWCKACCNAYRKQIHGNRYIKIISHEALARLKERVKQCEICGADGKLFVDHDHKVQFVRGLLCPSCNCGLGHFRDSPELLRKAVKYLRRKPRNV
jgi:hypothetical protein